MGTTAGRDARLEAAARRHGTRIAVVCSDPVARVLALRLIEHLGHPSPQVFPCIGDALSESFSVLLVDEADIPPDADAALAASATRPRVLLMQTGNTAAKLRTDALLRKPLERAALAAALDDAPAAAADGEFDAAAWDELLRLFGRDGLTEMIDALQRDLPQQHRRCADALAAQDRATLKHIAHSLRGVALQFGFVDLAQECGAIEQSVAGQTPVVMIGADTARMLNRYAAMVRRLRQALHDA